MHISRTQIEDSGLIEFHQAAKRYGGDGGAVALQPLDLSIGRGGVFGIIGQSGAGKSTLLRLINGLERPSCGRVVVDGHDLSALGDAQLRALRRRIGMVFQHFNLLSSQTVAQNVAFPLRLDAGNTRAAIEARVAEALERVGLSAHASKYPAQLSGGQKQRVGIARALATRPDILLCDEATSALDPQTTASVLDLLQQLHRDLSLTVVLITHEMDVIRRICDHVAVLDAGHLVETGKVVDVFLEPQHAVTQRFLRESGHDAATDDTSRFADDPGCIVHLRVRGNNAPLLSVATRDFGTDIAWLDGRVGELRGVAFGDLTLSLRGGDVPGALAWLGTQGARIDVLREARP